ncbi:Solid-state culture specific protein [Penicillium ucsense]|uniref:Solid-state culture specific protein n=1 Tax=Penicillium ucsense TaxID=2839758 RepID=A0A8J8VWB2_9EURO|nr:Solid-state culture specific protein [Penicillium ucsense]KAF7734967.1 Solid-state culture specific protein [Penicillium ucsense]
MSAPGSVVLDYTLHDLYHADDQDYDICMVNAYAPPPSIPLAAHIPAIKQFPVQAPLCPAYDQDELTRTILHLVAQRFAFCAGPMRILVLESESLKSHCSSHGRSQADISKVFSQLQEKQRPLPSFVPISDLSKFRLDAKTKLAVTGPLDWFSHIPQVIDPRIHYNLLSKRGLAKSGLPTPRTIVIDTVLSPTEPFTDKDLQREIARMTKPILEHPIPFIVKVPRITGVGQGTFIVHTEADRSSVYDVFLEEVKLMLLALNPANECLQPCNVIIQEMVPGETASLNFFVTQTGRAIFNCCNHQEVDDAYIWSGGLVSYNEQAVLESQYRGTMDAVAHFLYKHGYYGPAGVDIMTDETGAQFVVDLNVRITATYHLGPLRGHFTRRGFSEAAAMSTFRLTCTQAEFESHFAEELCSGSLVLTAWVHLQEASLVTMTVAARDRTGLQEIVQKVSMFADNFASTNHSYPS